MYIWDSYATAPGNQKMCYSFREQSSHVTNPGKHTWCHLFRRQGFPYAETRCKISGHLISKYYAETLHSARETLTRSKRSDDSLAHETRSRMTVHRSDSNWTLTASPTATSYEYYSDEAYEHSNHSKSYNNSVTCSFAASPAAKLL